MLFLSQCSLFTVFVLEAGFLTGKRLSKWSRLAGSQCTLACLGFHMSSRDPAQVLGLEGKGFPI